MAEDDFQGALDALAGYEATASKLSRKDAAWQRFVLTHGAGALNRDLAHVLERTVEEIELAKRSLPVGGNRRGDAQRFERLFEVWRGRPPSDDEWPAPTFYPRRGSYEWQPPEVALLATLVGQMGAQEIADALSVRLQKVTGDSAANRDRMAVQNQISRMGLMASDVLGGITVAKAAAEVGSSTLVRQAIRNGQLKARRVGRQLVIPHKAWNDWKAKTKAPPADYVQLSTLKGPLGIASDKLSEFARMGYVPDALQVKPYGTKSMRTTQFGSWYVPQPVAERLLADRKAGRPMPWHGKPILDNLKVTYRLWQSRVHPKECDTCSQIWGADGAPRDFEDYIARYPMRDHGAKRHLTMVWSPGLSVAETAAKAGRSDQHVRTAIANGMLAARMVGRLLRVTRTDAARWIARKCPTGDNEKSWLSIDAAAKQYLFTPEELEGLCERGVLNGKVGTDGAMRGIRYVSRHQCAQLREERGFTVEQAAARARVTVPQLQALLKGVNWRGAEGIPLTTLQAVIKRIQSQQGLSVNVAAQALGTTAEWINVRIADGTITVKRNKWDDRIYISHPMLERLRKAQIQPTPRRRLSADWVRLSEAATLAGVSTTTLIRWGESGDVRRSLEASGWHYQQDDVRARARGYWQTVRFKRARAPAWLRAEQQCTGQPAVRDSHPDATVMAGITEASEPLANPWAHLDRVALGPLIELRQEVRKRAGMPRESARRVGAVLAEQFGRLKDMDLINFRDLDPASHEELNNLATAFVGVPISTYSMRAIRTI